MTALAMVLLGSAGAEWLQDGGDPQNTHLSSMLGGSAEAPQVKWQFSPGSETVAAVADVDGDDTAEVLLSARYLYCLSGPRGEVKWQFGPADTGSAFVAPAVADLNGDGAYEVVVADSGTVHCLRGQDGTELWRSTRPSGLSWMAHSLKVADLDGDGVSEILVPGDSLWVLGADGAVKWVAPYSLYSDNAFPAVGDVDGDGQAEVVLNPGVETVVLRGSDGSLEWTSRDLLGTYYYIWNAPALADVDGDGDLEVIVSTRSHNPGQVLCFSYDQDSSRWKLAWAWSDTAQSETYSSPMVGDVDGDGDLEVVVGGKFTWKAFGIDALTGDSLWVAEFSFGTFEVHKSGAIVDVDGDGKLEALFSNGNGDTLYCLNAEDGSLLWTKALANDIHQVSVGDVDADRAPEIVVPTASTLFVLDVKPLYIESSENLGGATIRLFPTKAGLKLVAGKPGVLRLYTLDGRVALERELQPGEHLLRLKPGVYFWRFGSSSGKAVVR